MTLEINTTDLKTLNIKKEYNKIRYEENKDKDRKWREENKDKLRIYSKKWYEENKGKIRTYSKKWYEENKERKNLTNKKWREENKKRKRLTDRKWRKENKDKVILSSKKIFEKLKQNKSKYRMQYLRLRLSVGIRRSLKKTSLGESFKNFLEFSLDSLKKRLEKKMTKGMSWENIDKWNIDHMIPYSWFEFENPIDEQFKLCWNLNNLQPMWSKRNQEKNNRYKMKNKYITKSQFIEYFKKFIDNSSSMTNDELFIEIVKRKITDCRSIN